MRDEPSTPPSTPIDFPFTAHNDRVVLTWEAPVDGLATRYRVLRQVLGGSEPELTALT